jgi:cytochrome c oxidase cbb3-type subunit IV
MSLQQIFDNASSIMTLISFLTFCGILLWTFVLKRGADFTRQAALPFADEDNRERGHG